MSSEPDHNSAFKSSLSRWFPLGEQMAATLFVLKWLLICLVVGSLVGSASAFLLVSLNWVTNYRESNNWIILLLPVAGFVIGLLYHYVGANAVKGNNLLLEEIHKPKNTIPLRMAPLVLFGTLATHLVGGSAGREGTAVQMGGAIADQFTRLFRLRPRDRRILLITGISAGFASLFGTPLAGAVFGLEVFLMGRLRYEALLPSFFAAVIANFVCAVVWGVGHTHYGIPWVPNMSVAGFGYTLLAGTVFGLAGMLFSKAIYFWGSLFKKLISYPPLRPVAGGAVLAGVIPLIDTTKYLGLGIPTILAAFSEELPVYDAAAKLLFTSFTLGAGFKGGEVTPLFFTGAALGNALSQVIPLPMALLAGMGFVAVFSGATNTPLTCTIMAMELFGTESSVYMALACVVAFLFSGHSGIYGAQIIGSPKHLRFGREKGRSLAAVTEQRKNKRDK